MSIDQKVSAHLGELPRTHATGRVLLAEDDDDTRALLAEVLREDGYEVVEAADGAKALIELAEAYQREGLTAFDAVVSDVRMPVCTGVMVLEALRAAHWTMPAIMMSGTADDATRRKIEGLDALLIRKPFELDDLLTVLAHVVTASPSNQNAGAATGTTS